jgi:putative FmdB family regulatory protein
VLFCARKVFSEVDAVPLYEYECPKDGVFELMQKFSDPPLAACPKCGGPVDKLLSAPAIQFKGTGWYVTDYARKGKTEGGSPKAEKTESKDTASSKSKDSSSSSTTTGSSGSGSSTDKK